MNEERTIIEVFARIIRHGQSIIIIALLFSIILGGYQAYNQIKLANSEEYSQETLDEKYTSALKSYQDQKEKLENQLDETKNKLKSQKEYTEKSILFQIDPYNKYTTIIHLAISDVEENSFQQVFKNETTPIDYILTRIQSRYLITWSVLDLQKELNGYQGVEDRYLREQVGITGDAGIITITSFANTAEESQRIAEAAYTCIVSHQGIISDASYRHQLLLMNQTTRLSQDLNLADRQKNNQNNLKSLEDSIESLTKQLESLTEPQREKGYSSQAILRAILTYAFLGIALGVFFGVFITVFLGIFDIKLDSSYQLERIFSLTYFGTLTKKKTFFDNAANFILGERHWEDCEQAVSFIRKRSEIELKDTHSILLLSTLPISVDNEEVNAVISALGNDNREVCFESDILHNAEALEKISFYDSVIILEINGKTKLTSIQDLLNLTSRIGKSVAGFIII